MCEGGGRNKQTTGKGDAADDGGSTHAALPADTLSSDISAFMNQAGRSRLQRFPADALRSDEKLRPQCKHRAAALSFFPLPAFSIVCAMSSFTGRWFKGHGRKNRRLGIKEQWFFAIWQFQPHMSGIKLQRYLNYRYLSCTFSVKLQRYLNYCDFNRIINRKFTVFFGLS